MSWSPRPPPLSGSWASRLCNCRFQAFPGPPLPSMTPPSPSKGKQGSFCHGTMAAVRAASCPTHQVLEGGGFRMVFLPRRECWPVQVAHSVRRAQVTFPLTGASFWGDGDGEGDFLPLAGSHQARACLPLFRVYGETSSSENSPVPWHCGEKMGTSKTLMQESLFAWPLRIIEKVQDWIASDNFPTPPCPQTLLPQNVPLLQEQQTSGRPFVIISLIGSAAGLAPMTLRIMLQKRRKNMGYQSDTR